MREITGFGDAGEKLVQFAAEGEYTKKFGLVDGDGDIIIQDMIPCVANAHPNDGNECIYIRDLEESIELHEWAKATGLTYIPAYFHEFDKCPDEVLLCFGLMDEEENKTLVAQNLDEVIEDKTHPVEKLTVESEAKRESLKEGKSFGDKLMEMVHERGTVTYRLGTVESEIKRMEEEFQEKMQDLTTEKIAVLEVIDTYDKAIRIFFEEKGNA